MASSLEEFYRDEGMRKNVHSFLVDFLEKEAIKKVFDREDVAGVAEAKSVIDKAFEEMETLFSPKPKSDTKDQSR